MRATTATRRLTSATAFRRSFWAICSSAGGGRDPWRLLAWEGGDADRRPEARRRGFFVAGLARAGEAGRVEQGRKPRDEPEVVVRAHGCDQRDKRNLREQEKTPGRLPERRGFGKDDDRKSDPSDSGDRQAGSRKRREADGGVGGIGWPPCPPARKEQPGQKDEATEPDARAHRVGEVRTPDQDPRAP